MKLKYSFLITLITLVLSGCDSSSQNAEAKSGATASPTVRTEISSKKVDPIKELVTVYKSPTCSCCGRWITHLKANGFQVNVVNVNDVTPFKKNAGLTPALASCHTAFVGNYVVEGHVPAREIKRLLKEKPDIKGLAVPGMPMGSPGMEMGNKKDPHDVLSIDKNGKTKVYQSYR